MKKSLASLFACLGTLFVAGCGHVSGPVKTTDRVFLYRPRLIEQANKEMTTNPEAFDPKNLKMPTDRHVLVVVNDLTNVFRGRLNVAMAARHFSSFTQVVTAAAAATLTTLKPSEKTLITILAASSALMPQFQTIFDAKGRAAAYEQGAVMLANAEAAYFKALATTGKDFNPDQLTPQGAQLYQAALSAIQVVEQLSVSILPSVEQIRAAKGEFITEFANETAAKASAKAAPAVSLADVKSEQSVAIADLQTGSLVFSSATDVVTATADAGNVVLKPHKPGKATITAIAEKDGQRQVTNIPVTVPLTLRQNSIDAKEGDEITIETNPHSVITGFRFSSPDIVTSVTDTATLPNKPEPSVKLKASKEGTTTVTVLGEYGVSADVEIKVVKK